jgi:hypothetical protein
MRGPQDHRRRAWCVRKRTLSEFSRVKTTEKPRGPPGLLKRPAGTRSFVILFGIGAIACVVALVLGSRPLFEAARTRTLANSNAAADRTRAGRVAAIRVLIAPPAPREGPQRLAVANDIVPVASGERIRIGIEPGPREFYFVISIDAGGHVTPLYPEFGVSLPLPGSGAVQYLPEPIELSGRGQERLTVLLTNEPLEIDDIRRAVAASLSQVGGDITRLPNLAIAGDQFHRLLDKL